jgi:bacillithiol biosynthesis cysteine-adding enzyme BshC
MDCIAQKLSYEQTGFFSKIVIDYINEAAPLKPFYTHPVSIKGIKAAIEERKNFPADRKLLHAELQKQYASLEVSEKVKANIDKLLLENTFTITTAHQPNIFTGHLYFIYKILHAVKLAEDLAEQLPNSDFVPVFYMGSEDADLEELGHIYINGEKYEWDTKQTGAVGRMKVDKALVKLIDTISGQVTIHPFGEAIIALMKACYKEGVTIEQATLQLVNSLFGEYGLVILLPDNPALKRAFIPVVEKELDEQFSHKAVTETVAQFPQEYKVQASGRELNLFYLGDESRERIIAENSVFNIQRSMVNAQGETEEQRSTFNKQEIKEELQQHPERFSANVILRPVFQEMILPNIVFIGGGGEIAYWLELKKVFEAVQVSFPVMVVRNSFMFINAATKALAEKLQFKTADLFKKELDLLNELVKRDSKVMLSLQNEMQQITVLYTEMKAIAGAVDKSLWAHTEALQTQALKKIIALEKKMLKAEKKKFEAQQRQLHKLKAQLFPHNNLQERIENVMPFYAKWGKGFIDAVYKNSNGLKQEFCVLVED